MNDPFSISNTLVDEWVELDPLMATLVGVPGHDHRWPDLGPDGIAAERALVERSLGLFEPHLAHPDRWQRLAATVAHAYLLERHDEFSAGDHLYDVAHMDSSFDSIRSVFDLMDTGSEAGWEAIAARMAGMRALFDGYRAKLDVGIAAGRVAARRQTASLIAQARELKKIKDMTKYAQNLGLIVNAGHGLKYHNTKAIARIPGMEELNIGHSIIARAIFVGLEAAVKEMKKLVNG